jgi:hypothetical protein
MSQSANKWSKDSATVGSWAKTADDLLEVAGPEDQAWKEKVLRNRADAQELNAELQDVGVPFSVGDLVNLKTNYNEAIPVLSKHLQIPHEPDIVESIVRALAVRYGGEAAFTALHGYLLKAHESLRPSILFALGNAISATGGRQHRTELANVVRSPVYKDARLGPLLALAQMKDAAVQELAEGFLQRNEYPWYAMRALRRAHVWSALDAVRPFLTATDSEVRAEARRFVKAAEESRER